MVTSPPADVIIALEYKGFLAAAQRYQEATKAGDDPLAPLIPLAEALWWTVSIDEGLKKVNNGYAALRDSDPMGRVLRGLRYARNRIGHQRALVIKAEWFETYTQAPDGRWVTTYDRNTQGEWVETFKRGFAWRRLDELPLPPPRQGDPEGAAAYESQLQGRWASGTQADCGRWLSGVVNASRPAAE